MSRRTVTAVAAAAALFALAGPGPRAGAQEPGADGHSAHGDRLVFTVTDSGNGAHDGSYTLRCRPAGGNHPSPQRACAALERAAAGGEDPFKPVAPDAQCTMIHGGPATAHVSGAWRGQTVDARFKRTNGCEIDRWAKLVPALPDVS
ncbi:SSI family serine proteinase inhibitor [Streptomyces iconiensis]|uniref:SSI family serine proteinase inhibitor n=1 Tax=Streptomyces iconiensis TaxID=1384038 RepID=A0ABT6ZRS6_9ACTN|nr:SSI family serine proteinase inhibitor [Streptomyces iconiensis]MDJ1131760.1 SSI family serine proteinase inhibitor [Streptomyces iconiensis]